MRSLATVCLAAMGLALCTSVGRADDLVNPKRYTSASSAYELFVDPSDRDGIGSASYTMRRDGEVVWSRDHEFALFDAAITDEGVVVGYSYENGLNGRRSRGRGSKESYLWTVILDETGEVRLKDGRPRKHPPYHSNPPGPYVPLASGVTVVPDSDLILVRIAAGLGDDEHDWWRYRLSTGERLDDLTPEQPTHGQYGFHSEMSVRQVPGRPLLLVHWFLWDNVGGNTVESSRLSVLDVDGREVWTHIFDHEYMGFGERFDARELKGIGVDQVALIDSGFSYLSFAEKARIDYHVERDGDGWRIGEVARVDDEFVLASVSAPGELETLELETLGVITLRAGGFEPFGPISTFSIDPGGDIGFVRHDEERGDRLVIVDGEGTVVHDVALGLGDLGHRAIAIGSTNETWIVMTRGDHTARASAWRVTPETGEARKIEGFWPGRVGCAAAMPDGGLVIIDGSNRRLVCYSALGESLWSHGQTFPKDIAVCGDGRVLCMADHRGHVEVYGADGTHLETIDIAARVGGRTSYTVGVSADRNGGLVVHDFNGHPPVYRFAPDGEVSASFTPKYADGREFRLYGGVQVDPAGGLWTSDGHALLRLGADGVVERVIGDKPGEAGLTKINMMAVGPNGDIFAESERDAGVFRFDRNGALLGVMRPNPTDFEVDIGGGSITVAGDGSVWYFHDAHSGDDQGYLGFDAGGDRIGFWKPPKLSAIREKIAYQPGTLRRWVIGYESLALVDEHGEVVKQIRKRPDNNWIGRTSDFGVAPDGSLAIRIVPDGLSLRGGTALCVYDRDGEPSMMTMLEYGSRFGRIAAFDDHIAIASGRDLHVYAIGGGRPRLATLPGDDEEHPYWYVYTSPEGDELWARRSGSFEIIRFRIPDDRSVED